MGAGAVMLGGAIELRGALQGMLDACELAHPPEPVTEEGPFAGEGPTSPLFLFYLTDPTEEEVQAFIERWLSGTL